MTVRGFLAWYLGAITFVGVSGASGYQALLHRHAMVAASTPTEPQVVADASPVPAAVPPAPSVAAEAQAPAPSSSAPATPAPSTQASNSSPAPAAPASNNPPASPKAHAQVSTATALPRLRPPVSHAPGHRTATVVHSTTPIYPTQPYAQPPAVTYYAYPAYYPYAGYYAYYPRYRYYRAY